MSEPHGPREEAAGPEREPEPPQAGAQPPTESEPAPSAAPPPDADAEPNSTASPPPPYGMPPGRYLFVPDDRRNRGVGPAFGRFVRNRATHLVAAVVVGALIGGGTVAIFDKAVDHPGRDVQVRPGGPFDGHRFPGFRFGDGGQGFGN